MKLKALFSNMQYVKVGLVAAAVVIAAASLVVSNVLVGDMAKEEEKSMEVWAEAMRTLQRADEATDLTLVLKVINGNTTIPIIVTDEHNDILAARNVDLPQDSIDILLASPDSPQRKCTIDQLCRRAEKMKAARHVIQLPLSTDDTHGGSIYVCYEPSLMLTRLTQYPYVQLGVVALFIAVAILALLSSKRAEQNKVWVGLSRETAHQLGTPISSLMAGSEILKETYPDDPVLPEMDKDVRRLQLIAERFSKIGSVPVLEEQDLGYTILKVVEYLGRRTSDKVSITTHFDHDEVKARINAPLFEWVIENLCKNAIDAMAGVGSIHIDVATTDKHIAVEVHDTGKGIPRKNFRNVFKPGYTTKRRGWGLGLSLAKRIVEEYHGGKIFVKDSEPGKGTTFCILLKNKHTSKS